MVLTEQERTDLRTKFTRLESRHRNNIAVNKVDLQIAVNDIDDWIETSQASFLSSTVIPISNKQKLKIFLDILNVRWGQL